MTTKISYSVITFHTKTNIKTKILISLIGLYYAMLFGFGMCKSTLVSILFVFGLIVCMTVMIVLYKSIRNDERKRIQKEGQPKQKE